MSSSERVDVPWVSLELPRRAGAWPPRPGRPHPPGVRGRGCARCPGPALVTWSPFCVRSAFDLVNIHLFHDASNLVAWETSPSAYAGIRHKALAYVLDR